MAPRSPQAWAKLRRLECELQGRYFWRGFLHKKIKLLSMTRPPSSLPSYKTFLKGEMYRLNSDISRLAFRLELKANSLRTFWPADERYKLDASLGLEGIQERSFRKYDPDDVNYRDESGDEEPVFRKTKRTEPQTSSTVTVPDEENDESQKSKRTKLLAVGELSTNEMYDIIPDSQPFDE